MAGALVSREGDTIRLVRQATPRDSAAAVVTAIGALIQDLLDSKQDPASEVPIGIGLPAQIDFGAQKIMFCTNLPLGETDVAGELSERFKLPLVIDNDANLAALAETRFGAAAACGDVVCITLGTGIGGGLILDGNVYRGSVGAGGEIGHMIIDASGPDCACGGKGCFETLAAGPALVRRAKAAVRDHPESHLAGLAGGDPEAVQGEMITEAAKAGDPEAARLLSDIGRIVGIAVTSLVNLLNPEIVVIGGGMIDAEEFILEPARQVVAERAMEGAKRGLRIVAATLGNNAGYLGAAALAFEHLGEGGG